MWRSEILYARMTYRGNSDYKHYDYKRKASVIPYTPLPFDTKHTEAANVKYIKTHEFGMQHWIPHAQLSAASRIDPDTNEPYKIGVGVAGNSGIPFGYLALNTPSTQEELKAISYDTQEEDIVRSWILTELHLKKNQGDTTTTIETYLNKLKKNDGTWAYGLLNMSDTDEKTNWKTIQDVNYTKPNVNKTYPIERLYADAYVIPDARIAGKKSKDEHDFGEYLEPTHVVMSFVAGPQADPESLKKEERSTTRRTYNPRAANPKDYTHFRECVKWTYYACLHSLAMQGCRIVLLPWICGESYAGPHRPTYGTESDGNEVIKIVNEVLDMRAYGRVHGKSVEKKLKDFFHDVSIHAIKYGPASSAEGKKKVSEFADSVDKPTKKPKHFSETASSSAATSSSSFKFMAYNILANAKAKGTPMENTYLKMIKQKPWKEGRKYVVCETLKKASVLGLTEVTKDMFVDIEKELSDYQGVLIEKNGGYGDNSVIMWKKEMFVKEGEEIRKFLGGSQVFAAQKLKDKITENVFAVVVLHLKAGGFDYEAFRKEQLNSALELIKKHFSGIPCILCGDFNSNSMTYKTGNCYEIMAQKSPEWKNVFQDSAISTHIEGPIFDYMYLHRISFTNPIVLASERGSDHYPLIADLSL